MNSAFKTIIACAQLVLLGACGKKAEENKFDSALAVETDALDVRITDAAPDEFFNSEQLSVVGFQDGSESRMLLYFPHIEKLRTDDVTLSSITAVELFLSTAKIPVNPANIELRPLAETWTPFATWNSRAAVIPGYGWQLAGGTPVTGRDPVSPDIRKHDADPEQVHVRFDITALVLDMVANGVTNHGFVISVKKSVLNSSDEMTFETSNSTDGRHHPKSALVFTKKE